MRDKKPKTLYEYNTHHELEKHELEADCFPEIISRSLDGTRWRCQSGCHDFYGWDKLKSSKIAEIAQTKNDIAALQQHLENLTKNVKSEES